MFGMARQRDAHSPMKIPNPSRNVPYPPGGVGLGLVSGASDEGAESVDMALVSFRAKQREPASDGAQIGSHGVGLESLKPNIYLTLE